MTSEAVPCSGDRGPVPSLGENQHRQVQCIKRPESAGCAGVGACTRADPGLGRRPGSVVVEVGGISGGRAVLPERSPQAWHPQPHAPRYLGGVRVISHVLSSPSGPSPPESEPRRGRTRRSCSQLRPEVLASVKRPLMHETATADVADGGSLQKYPVQFPREEGCSRQKAWLTPPALLLDSVGLHEF